MFKSLILILTSVVVLSISAVAGVPQFISYQGSLLDSTGAPVADGPHLFKFIIWNDPAATAAANEKWNSGFQNITVNDGLFEYQLGSNVPLPDGLFSNDTNLYLGVTEGANLEMSPRTKLVSVGYAFHALRADTADIALSSESADSSSTVSDNSITSAKIADGSILDADINSSAAINVTKISGTAVNLSSNQTITGEKTFSNYLKIGDSTFRANNLGIKIGDGGIPTNSDLMFLERRYNTASHRRGLKIRLINEGTGSVTGFLSDIGSHLVQGQGSLTSVIARSGAGSGASTGIIADGFNSTSSTNNRYGVRSRAGFNTNTGGISYGILSEASGGAGSTVYGVYAAAFGSASSKYAGWFQGNVNVTGTLSKGGGSFKIDHPLDPENKYLQHSFVESPDMMNVYNGNVVLDVNGEATVTMPDYFETLNKDFRYQLTAIGAPGPNLYIAEKISSNQFSIAGGDPYSEVSWQVTGVRQDKWAEKNRIQVELDKPVKELGLYMHYEEYGFGIERSIHKEQLEHDRLEQERNESNEAFE